MAELPQAVVAPAEHLVMHSALTHVARHKLRTLSRDVPVDDSGIATPLLSAPARRGQWQLVRPIRNREEPSRRGKDIKEEICGQTKDVDIDTMIVYELGELIDLRERRELHFVDHEYFCPSGEQVFDVREKRGARLDGLSCGFDTDPTRHHAVSTSIPECSQDDVTSALTELPAELESKS